MDDAQIARDQMITQQLISRGIVDARVIEAMRQTPRERFVPRELSSEAYADRALPIAEDQTISQPYIVALMAQAAAISPEDRLLEVGAGSGYGAAVLSHLAARVWSIERLPRLARRAGASIAELGLANVTVLRGDGAAGWAPAAPFNVIIVTAAATKVPDALLQQLAPDGRLIIPIGPPEGPQRLLKMTRSPSGGFQQEDLGAVAFVPLIAG